MSNRFGVVVLTAALPLASGAATLRAGEIVEHPYPGITYITRIEAPPAFPRNARMNILLIDLTSPAVKFKLTPPGENLPGRRWPARRPRAGPSSRSRRSGNARWTSRTARTRRRRSTSTSSRRSRSRRLDAERLRVRDRPGRFEGQGVFSGFESPIQSYAIVTDSPAVNIDKSNNAGIVHRDPDSQDGFGVLEDVEIWNAFAGSGQILTNGEVTVPEYKDAMHPDALLTPGPNPPFGNPTYSRPCRHWYDLSNARAAVGISQDGKKLGVVHSRGQQRRPRDAGWRSPPC